MCWLSEMFVGLGLQLTITSLRVTLKTFYLQLQEPSSSTAINSFNQRLPHCMSLIKVVDLHKCVNIRFGTVHVGLDSSYRYCYMVLSQNSNSDCNLRYQHMAFMPQYMPVPQIVLGVTEYS